MTRARNLARTHSWLLVLCALFASPVVAQVVPTGRETRVSGSLDSRQRFPAAAARKDGFLLTWEDDHLGVYGRRFTAAGAPQTAALLLVPSDPLPPLPFYGYLKEAGEPAVAVKAADSSFLLVWVERNVQRSLDIFVDQRSVASTRLLARRFAADGKPLAGTAGALRVIAPAAGSPGQPAIAAAPDGGFWITWSEYGAGRGGIHLRRLDAQGRLGKDTKIAPAAASTPLASAAVAPTIALGGDGFLVAWEQCCDAGGARQVFARLFKAAGAPNGAAFKVPTLPGRSAVAPFAAGRAGKEFLVVWESAPVDGSQPPSVHGQLISKAGALVQAEEVFIADDETAYLNPVAGATADRGGWLLVWSVVEDGGHRQVDGRSFGALLDPVGPVVHFSQGPLHFLWTELTLATMPNGRAFASWVGMTDDRQQVGIRSRGGKGPVRR